jgi:hypothetical protein
VKKQQPPEAKAACRVQNHHQLHHTLRFQENALPSVTRLLLVAGGITRQVSATWQRHKHNMSSTLLVLGFTTSVTAINWNSIRKQDARAFVYGKMPPPTSKQILL